MNASRFLLALFLLLTACACGNGASRPPAQPAPPGLAVLEIEIHDAKSGKPVTRANIVGRRSGGHLTALTPSKDNVAEDGVHRYEIEPLQGQVRIAAPGYTETWSSQASLAPGETKRLAMNLQPLARLVVSVLAKDGTPVREGSLLLTGPDLEMALAVKNGVADSQIDAGSFTLVADPDMMKGYAPLQKGVVLRPGERTDVHLELTKQ